MLVKLAEVTSQNARLERVNSQIRLHLMCDLSVARLITAPSKELALRTLHSSNVGLHMQTFPT